MNFVSFFKPSLDGEEEIACMEAISQNGIGWGVNNEFFENKFAGLIGTSRAISVNSGTTALYLALLANNIKGEVIVPSFSSIPTINSILINGATPVFIDVNISDRMVDANLIAAAITKRTEAVIVFHFGGQCADMQAISKLCERHKLLLIEDCSQAIMSPYKEKMAGSYGIGCFSFGENSTIYTGEGGMITTDDRELHRKLEILSHDGTDMEKFVMPSGNYLMSGLTAVIGTEQLNKLPRANIRQKSIGKFYSEALQNSVAVPEIKTERPHNFQVYSVLLPCKRNEFRDYLTRKHVCVEHPEKTLHSVYGKKISLPYTEWLVDHILYLPIYPMMKDKDVHQVAFAVVDASNCLFQFDEEYSEYLHQVAS